MQDHIGVGVIVMVTNKAVVRKEVVSLSAVVVVKLKEGSSSIRVAQQ
jgi:hypothetical protein